MLYAYIAIVLCVVSVSSLSSMQLSPSELRRQRSAKSYPPKSSTFSFNVPRAHSIPGQQVELTDTSSSISSSSTEEEGQHLSHTTPLMIAAAAGNINEVAALLGNPSDINKQHPISGRSAIFNAPNADIATSLFLGGADINLQDAQGSTPIMEALLNKNYDLVDFYLYIGADLSLRDNTDRMALHHALATQCDEDIIERLICSGAEINGINYVPKKGTWKKRTIPLRIAIENKNIEQIRILLAYNCVIPVDLMNHPLIKEAKSRLNPLPITIHQSEKV